MPELKLGYNGPEYYRWYDYVSKYAPSYKFLLGTRDGYFGLGEDSFVREMQRRLNASGISMVIDGKFGDRTASAIGYRWSGTSTPPKIVARRKIWYYSFPGSGANFDVGPAFEVGVHCKNVLNINHQPVYFQKGGYLGFLGGDPKFSYVEVTWDQHKSLEWLLDNNADVQEAMRLLAQGVSVWDLELELEFGAFSQSEDGLEDSLEILFGDGGFIHPGDKTRTPSAPGKYRALRDRINFVHAFGNPSKHITGIARKTRPLWLREKIVNFNHPNDFYAEVPLNDAIRPAFYAEIILAEMELPYFVHVLRIAVPIIMKWASAFIPFIGPLLGGFGPMVQLGMGMISGLQGVANNPAMGGMLSLAGSNIDLGTTSKIEEILAPQGFLTNIPALIGLVAALPGLQAHGDFGPLVPLAIRHVNDYRRPVRK